VVAALLQFLCGDGGGARVAGVVVKMEAAREVDERSREEENGVAMVALRSCDGGRKRVRCAGSHDGAVVVLWRRAANAEARRWCCGNSRWSEMEQVQWCKA